MERQKSSLTSASSNHISIKEMRSLLQDTVLMATVPFLLSCSDNSGFKGKKEMCLKFCWNSLLGVSFEGKKSRKQGRKWFFSLSDEMCTLASHKFEGLKCILCFLLLLTPLCLFTGDEEQ